MGLVRSQVEFDHDSGLARDRIVNTFHHLTDSDPPHALALDAIRDRIVAGYTAVQAPGTTTLMSYFSTVLSGTWRIKHYDVEAPPESPPLRIDTPAALSFTAANGLPSENALVLSYDRFPRAAAIPTGRQRGRLYFGPFNTNTVGSNGRPDTAVRNAILGFGAMLMAASNVDAEWCVYSPSQAAALGGVNSAITVNRCRVDDEWDTQRRRGLRPTGYLTILGT